MLCQIYWQILQEKSQYLKQKDTTYCLDGYTILKSDLINNMDHMHISGIEPSSMILSQTKEIVKLEMWWPKTSKTNSKDSYYFQNNRSSMFLAFL